MNASSFSILIPYHTHPETVDFVKRQIKYYHTNPLPTNIILAISGDDLIKNELKNFLGDINDSRFILLSSEEKNIKNVISFNEKILFALQTVKTPYVAINGADDVLLIEMIEKGVKVLEDNNDIAAVKGHTILFDCNSGNITITKDLDMVEDSPYDRIKCLMEDRGDSIFYNIRRTEEFIKDYQAITQLSLKSEIVGNSLYHVEHFVALSIVSQGKVFVIDSPWRIQSNHPNNHTSHTPASFIRVMLGILDKDNYEWFRSINTNMNVLSYKKYRFLWILHQIRGISVTFKQIAYHFLYKKCSMKNSTGILI